MFVTFIISLRGFGNLSRYLCLHLGSCIQEIFSIEENHKFFIVHFTNKISSFKRKQLFISKEIYPKRIESVSTEAIFRTSPHKMKMYLYAVQLCNQSFSLDPLPKTISFDNKPNRLVDFIFTNLIGLDVWLWHKATPDVSQFFVHESQWECSCIKALSSQKFSYCQLPMEPSQVSKA